MQATTLSSRPRIQSVDIARGIIIVIMGLDHIRDFLAPTLFSPEDVTQTTPLWFFTRWITHFCAPGFVFLAGISAFMYGQKVPIQALRKFLITRGVWLIVMELTVVHFGWTFNFNFWFVQVIWVIGWSMIILALLTYLPRAVIVFFTAITLLGHNLLDGIHFDSIWWYFFHEQNWYIPIGSTSLAIIYPLVPWPAVMALGYLMGELFLKNEEERNKKLMLVGGMVIVAFIIIRLLNIYGDAHLWTSSERGGIYTVLDFLNTTKYPPSLLFLGMTLGPLLLVLPRLEKWTGYVGQFFLTFGRVPFFYYIIHFYIGHTMGIIYNGLMYGKWDILIFADPKTWPENYVPNLAVAYGFWIVLTVMMYFLCQWFGEVKKRRNDWWLKYL
jgi:uncharacterized membrane protein